MICLACGTIEGPKKGASAPCSQCGEPLSRETRDNLKLATEAMALARVRELVAQWTDEGLIDRPSSLRIQDRISRAGERLHTPEPPPLERLPRSEVFVPPEPVLPPPPAPPPPSAREIEVVPHDVAVSEGLSVLAAIDAPPREPGAWETEVRPLLYENIGWFIGTLFVLAGSIYGVREAWRTLGGVARHATVGGALFAYHALFVGLAAILARKSITTGKVLASIALGLLPVVFVALSSALQVSVPLGATIGAVFSAGALFTTASAARRLEIEKPYSLAFLFVPTLAAELPLAVTAPDAWGRVALPFVGVAAAAFAGRRRSLGTELAVGYAAIALGIYALVGGPDDAARGAIAGAGFGLWAAALAGVVVASADRMREDHPRATSVLTIGALGTLLVIALSAAPAAFARARETPDVLASRGLTLSAVVAAFALVARRRIASLHIAAILAPFAGFFFARALFSGTNAAALLGVSVAVAGMMITGSIFGERPRAILVGWSVPYALGVLMFGPFLDTRDLRWTLLAALTLAVCAHASASVRNRGLHYLGGLALTVACVAFVLPGAVDRALAVERAFSLLAALFALAAFGFDARAAALGEADEKRARPFDDLSSGALWLALFTAIGRLSVPLQFDLGAIVPALRARPMIVIIAVAFIARGVRDRSACGSFIGVTIAGLAAMALARVQTAGQTAYLTGAIALALAICASIRGRSDEPAPIARRVFGVVPLPFAARGVRAIGDGFALGAWVSTIASIAAMFAWMANRNEAERPLVVLGGAMLIGAQLAGFLLPAFQRFGLRGSLAALSMTTVLIGLTAVANRVGRPLPAPVVGLRLSIVAAAVWGVARLAQWRGEALGRALGNESAGKRYHVVFHAAVGVLGLVLVVDALVIAQGSITIALTAIPPTMLLGAALAALLLSLSLRAPRVMHVAAPLGILAAALLSTQQSFLGTVNPIALPTSVAWGRALLGPALAAVLFALAATVKRALPLAIWTAILAGAVGVAGWYRVEVIPSALIVLGGAALFVTPHRKLGRAVIAVSAMSVVHALAQRAPQIPGWTGSILAVLASTGLLGDEDDDARPALDVLAALGFLAAFVYALAAGAAPDPIRAGGAVVSAALGARWVLADALAPTAAVSGVALAIAGVRARGERRAVAAQTLGALYLIAAAVSGTFAGDRALHLWPSASDATWLSRTLAPTIACALAVLAALHHVIALLKRTARAARDVLLLAAAAAGIAFVLAGQAPNAPAPGGSSLLLGAGAIAIAAATATHVAFRERSSRHVYYVQLAAVATYGLFRSELLPNVPRETDAIFALCLGFLLLGVTVAARRAQIPEIAVSTRTFAALLPIFVALILPHRASMSAAMIAAFSGALYGALGWVERSRVLGSLGAAACNLSLLFLAMSQGLTGREIQLAALGLFVLALGHLFASSMEHGARIAVRVSGALFLYAPAAYRLATELGNAPNGAYSVGFGVACLVGILAGMVFHIRAYLAFGTGFLLLDVIANLTAAGVRDHRIGFVVLSLAGISILGAMVFVTLKRELVNATTARLRLVLGRWD